MSRPLISIIVPVYKTEKYLRRCIESLLQQTYRNLEIILVDDGSPDNSGRICDEYARNNSCVVSIHKENGGVSSARNAGIDASHGDYIGFVDSDDYIDSTMYEFLLQNILGSAADIAQCGFYEEITETERKNYHATDERYIFSQEQALAELFWSTTMTPGLCNKLFKRNLFDGIRSNEKFTVAEDLLLNYLLFQKANRVVVVNRPLYHYCFRSDSCVNEEFSEKHFQEIEVVDFILEKETNPKVISEAVKRKAFLSWAYARRILISGKFMERYAELRRTALMQKYRMIFTNEYSTSVKLKLHILLFWLAPRAYLLYLRIRLRE